MVSFSALKRKHSGLDRRDGHTAFQMQFGMVHLNRDPNQFLQINNLGPGDLRSVN